MKVYYRFRNTRANYRILEDTLEHLCKFEGIEHKYESLKEKLERGSLVITYGCENDKLTISTNKRDLEN